METPIYIFISASKLHTFWRNVPKEILENSLFFFGSKRHWLFPDPLNEEEIMDSKAQPTDYLSFDKEFLEIIKMKELKNEVYFLKEKETTHYGDYNKVSRWLESHNLQPLWLTDTIWEMNKDVVIKNNYYDMTIEQIKNNYITGNHFYNEVMALLKYSNPNTIPCLEYNII